MLFRIRKENERFAKCKGKGFDTPGLANRTPSYKAASPADMSEKTTSLPSSYESPEVQQR